MKNPPATDDPRPGYPKSPASVRTVLTWLVLSCFLPGLVGGVFLLQREYHNARVQLQERTLQTARALVQAVDAQLAQAQLMALSLSDSGSLSRKDFAAFHRRAKALADGTNFAQAVVIYDPSGQQLVNTRIAYGQSLPISANLQQIQQVFSSAKPVVSDVFTSSVDGRPVVSVAAPVFSGSKLEYALAVGISPQRFSAILSDQNLPSDWVVAIIDSAGTIAARTHSPEKFVGAKAVSDLLKHLQQKPEGIEEIVTREGIETVTPYSRSPRTGWSVAIGIPRAGFETPLMRGLLLLAVGTAVLLVISIAMVRFWGGRIANSVTALRHIAIALGNGETVDERPLQLKETDEVGQAMFRAATLLKERKQALELAHEAMDRRETELADAQRIAGIGSWTWDIATDTTQSSVEMCVIFGLREIPHFAQQGGVMFPHEAWRELRQARLAMARTGQGYGLELPALRSDGSPIWVEMRAEVVRGPDGDVTGLRGTVQDITERKQSETVASSERFIRTITNALPTLVAYWDTGLRCRFFNQSYLDFWGRSAKEMDEITLDALMGESLFKVNEPSIRAALHGEEQHFERFLSKPDGSVGHVIATYIPDKDAHGQVRGFIILVTDIKAQKLAEANLQLAANVYENISDAIMVTDMDGVIQSVNPAFTTITGYPAQEAIGKTPRLLRSDRHDQAFHAAVWQQVASQGHWQGEIWNRRKTGEVFLEWQTITRIGTPEQKSARYVAVFHDITDSWQRNEDIRRLAFHDVLTKLPNRALLMERLERQIAIAEREPRLIAVMFLDIDGFKAVNDTLGHSVGDELLVAIGSKLQGLVRQADTVARFGGDEFVIHLDNPASREEVVQVADRVIAVINEPLEIQGRLVQVAASIGVALYPDNGATAEGLIKGADMAMYEAKRAGKNRYSFFGIDSETKTAQTAVD